jgi:hypothetical protein
MQLPVEQVWFVSYTTVVTVWKRVLRVFVIHDLVGENVG